MFRLGDCVEDCEAPSRFRGELMAAKPATDGVLNGDGVGSSSLGRLPKLRARMSCFGGMVRRDAVRSGDLI